MMLTGLFRLIVKVHPEDPFGPTSDGAAYLFDEFNRLGVLQTELFVDDEKFKGRDEAIAGPHRCGKSSTVP